MDNMRRSANEAVLSFSPAGRDRNPAAGREHFILGRRGIDYSLIDLRNADWGSLGEIIDECSQVESACWTPQENFADYLRRCDILCYAERDGSIIGFTAVSMMFSRRICLYSNDETMVLREFRKRKVALSLVMLPLEWIFTRTPLFGGIDHIVFTSISANPRVVNFYFKNAWTRIFFDCSFKPSLPLMAAKNEYCRRHRIELVHEDYPFCMKNLFPGSNKFGRGDPGFQFSHKVRANMPPEFDHMERGDAFAFMLRIPKAAARVVVRILMFRCFGRDYLVSREIGPFSARRVPRAPGVAMHAGRPVKMTARPVGRASRDKGSRTEEFPGVSPRNGTMASPDLE